MTEPEKRLWRQLSNKQLGGYKFRHQTELDPAIADFFCPQKALVVEVDGATHTAEADARRDGRVAERGFTTIRFTNDDVMTNMDGVPITILNTLDGLPDRWDRACAPPDCIPLPNPWGAGPSPGRALAAPHPEGEGL